MSSLWRKVDLLAIETNNDLNTEKAILIIKYLCYYHL